MKWWEALLVVAALAVVPTLAYNESGARTDSAAVAADATSLLGVTNLAPTAAAPLLLNNANDYEANAIVANNQHTATVSVTASLIENPQGRFALGNPRTVTLGVGSQNTFKVLDDVTPHGNGCYSVVIRLDTTVQGAGGVRVGHTIVDRRVYIQVGNRC